MTETASTTERTRFILPAGVDTPLTISFDGERIASLSFPHATQVSLLNERATRSSFQAFHNLLSRLDSFHGIRTAMHWLRAVEDALGLDVPPKAKWFRSVLSASELIRHTYHTLARTAHAIDVHSPLARYAVDESRIHTVLASITNAPSPTAILCVGGLTKDTPQSFQGTLRRLAKTIRNRARTLLNLTVHNTLVRMRLRGVCTVSDEHAPEHLTGDCYDRIEKQGAMLLHACDELVSYGDEMPDGAYAVTDSAITPPDSQRVQSDLAAMIHHISIATDGIAVKAGTYEYTAPTPEGTLSIAFDADGTATPRAVRLTFPHTHIRTMCERTASGVHREDLGSYVASFGLSHGALHE